MQNETKEIICNNSDINDFAKKQINWMLQDVNQPFYRPTNDFCKMKFWMQVFEPCVRVYVRIFEIVDQLVENCQKQIDSFVKLSRSGNILKFTNAFKLCTIEIV